MKEYYKVSKVDFYGFVDGYGYGYEQNLKADIARICEPPCLSYNDFSFGLQWPESVVAKVMLFDNEEDRTYLITGKMITKRMAKKLKAHRFNLQLEKSNI